MSWALRGSFQVNLQIRISQVHNKIMIRCYSKESCSICFLGECVSIWECPSLERISNFSNAFFFYFFIFVKCYKNKANHLRLLSQWAICWPEPQTYLQNTWRLPPGRPEAPAALANALLQLAEPPSSAGRAFPAPPLCQRKPQLWPQ